MAKSSLREEQDLYEVFHMMQTLLHLRLASFVDYAYAKLHWYETHKHNRIGGDHIKAEFGIDT